MCHALLYVNRAKINRPLHIRNNDENIKFMHFLFEHYQPTCWWMETVEMTRRIMMTGGLVLILRGSAEQIILAIMVSMGSVRIIARNKPFLVVKGKGFKFDNNHLAEAMQWQLVGTLVCCLLLRFLEVGGRTEMSVLHENVLDVVLVGVQGGSLIFMLGRPVQGLVKRWLNIKKNVVVPVVAGADDGPENEEEGEETVSLLRMRLRRREQRIRELEEEVDDNAIEEGGEATNKQQRHQEY